ncbi:MAG: hypothetical protein ACPGVJ_03195 [Mangrovicoccus sp.]
MAKRHFGARLERDLRLIGETCRRQADICSDGRVVFCDGGGPAAEIYGDIHALFINHFDCLPSHQPICARDLRAFPQGDRQIKRRLLRNFTGLEFYNATKHHIIQGFLRCLVHWLKAGVMDLRHINMSRSIKTRLKKPLHRESIKITAFFEGPRVNLP